MPASRPRLLPKSWKSTIRLPQTAFPPRAPSKADQARYLENCTDKIYSWQQSQPREEVFTLHDGPPYANGKLHIGHALNKILKDITCRFQLSQGKRVDWVPGWDCHGLPIELKAVEQLKEQTSKIGTSSSNSPLQNALAIRRASRVLAARTVEEQKSSFREWGIMADWENYWMTMDKGFEVRQLEIFREMVKMGYIYRQHKPVFWSPSSRTALAEAELEYREDHVSTAAFVKFELRNIPDLLRAQHDLDKPIYLLVWTTTPWTLPANQAIAIHKDLTYVIVDDPTHGRLVVAESRIEEVQKLSKSEFQIVGSLTGSDLLGASYSDVVFKGGSHSRPILHADFVSANSGTGLVHIAPGHGADDYELGLRHGISAFAPIDDAGRFTALASPKEPALLEGKQLFSDGNKAVLDILSEYGHLLGQHEYMHKYPYDWRSKQPVVLRATEQWFANVGKLQTSTLRALDSVKFTPEGAIHRLKSFIKHRSEWCISRQRAWGVPIPALYDTVTGEATLTEESISHIIPIMSERGVDAWWSDDEFDPAWIPASLIKDSRQRSLKRGKDTMDVWFDSGTSWTQAKTPQNVADVYMEGSDQHRGWFQSSLLTYIASQGHEQLSQAPFRSLITHGFTLDEHGRKMSKSIGNVVSPDEIIEGSLLPPLTRKVDGEKIEFQDSMGVDALRLWVASGDYTKDMSVNPIALKAVNTTLAKYRVTFRQLLGILQDFDPTDVDLPETLLDNVHKVAIRQLENVEDVVRQCYQKMEYHRAVSEISRYIYQDLSAFYFEAIKDLAYCGTTQDRAEVQMTCSLIHLVLQQLLAPIVPLLVQETWEHTPPAIQTLHSLSPFQRIWASRSVASHPSLVLSDSDRHELDIDTPFLLQLLTTVQGLQEQARAAKHIGSSLQSKVTIHFKPGPEAPPDSLPSLPVLSRYECDLENILVVSSVSLDIDDDDRWSWSTPPSLLPTTKRKNTLLEPVKWSYQSRLTHNDGNEDHVVTVTISPPSAEKCMRCWRYRVWPSHSREEKETVSLCYRCEEVMEDLRQKEPELFFDSESSPDS